MKAIRENLKSDIDAKQAFIEVLSRRDFDEVRVTGSPSDITARRGADLYYFEIKYTMQSDAYFGAATLTEWEAALAQEDRFRFVVASRREGAWIFHEYTPAEFMAFSYIPPFKIFFNVSVGGDKAVEARRGTMRARLTRERVVQMIELFTKFRGK